MTRPQTPLLAVDIVIELTDRPGSPIVLIERKNAPHGWALPGGFVDIGETVDRAAVREALEETSLRVTLSGLLGMYSDPARDPRGHTVSIAYVATATGTPRAMDDARNLRVFDPSQIDVQLAFDHAKILEDYLALRNLGPVLPAQGATQS
jgi:8-oxo-dGTP diphosphatase